MTNLTVGKTTVPYSGASQSFTVTTQSTQLVAKLWAGAGAGGHWPNGLAPNGGVGGPGGYTTITLNLTLGDVVKVEVGQGGRPGVVTSGTTGAYLGTGGDGGWPDGGAAGFDKAACPGGGGGSTRLYVNNVLVAVAGAGGGDGIGQTNRMAGPGGGTTGGSGVQTLDGTGGAPTGGSQSAGGANAAQSTETQMKGASLSGGKGYPAASSQSNAALGTSGGGGGGGYFGGAGGGKAGQYVNGGAGGSGYFNTGATGYSTGSTTAGGATGGLPGNNSDADKPAGVGIGGTSINTGTIATQAGAGGNGAAVFSVTGHYILANGKNQVDFIGQDTVYDVTMSGTVTVKMWGGAGASTPNTSLSLPSKGGPGGYTVVTIPVTAGDVLTVKVGGGGTLPTVGTGGPGGWPDGGYGARNTGTEPVSSGGGGGGSTRIYLNGVLVAIAGGGGGNQGSRVTAGTVTNGGSGGDTNGVNGYVASSGVYSNGAASGASQVAGGLGGSNTNGQISSHNGSSLLGGLGSASAITVGDNSNPGGGGGGGYFGGGGGAGLAAATGNGPGGGGSGYRNGSYTGSMQSTAQPSSTPPNNGDADYVTGIAVGGGAANTPSNGGNGMAIITATLGTPANLSGTIGTATVSGISGVIRITAHLSGSLGSVAVSGVAGHPVISAHASGALGTITATGPAGFCGVTARLSGSLGTITATAPAGYPGVLAAASGNIGTITMESRIEASPESAALFIQDSLDFTGNPLILTAPTAVGSGRASVPLAGNQLNLGTLTLTGITGFYHSPLVDLILAFPGPITMTAPDGYAVETPIQPPLPGPIVLSPITGSAAGSALATMRAFLPTKITLTGIDGVPSTPDMTTSGNIGTITMSGIVGDGHPDGTMNVSGYPFDPIAMHLITGFATGEALTAGLSSGGGIHPYYGQLIITAFDANASGAASVTESLHLVISLTAPEGITSRGIDIHAPIGTIFMRKVLGYQDANPAYEADAFGEATSDIVLTPPVGVASVSVVASGVLGDIVVSVISGLISIPASALGIIGAIVVEEINGHGPSAGSLQQRIIHGEVVMLVEYAATAMIITVMDAQAIVEPLLERTALIQTIENHDAIVDSVVAATATIED